MSVSINSSQCSLPELRTQVRELGAVRSELASQVTQPSPSWIPTILGAGALGGVGAAIGASMRTFGGGHGGPATNIGVGLMLGGAVGGLIGTMIASSMVDKVDPAKANPDIEILDRRIESLNTRIVDCAVEGS